jgi:cytoskeletal protein CcmA (bactofilin family)
MKHVSAIWRRIVLGLTLLGVMAFGLAGSLWAADFRGGETVIIAQDEVIDDDLFVSGGRIEVNGTVKGDLFASGNEVVINGTVEGSLAIAGRTLQANGQVAGSVYGGGYALTLGPGAKVGRNLYFGGFSLETEAESSIGRSLYAGDYQTLLNGQVTHDVVVSSGALELNGPVGGDVSGEISRSEEGALPPFRPVFPGAVEMVPPGLRVGEGAEIGGQLLVKETGVEVRPPSFWRQVIWGVGRAIGRRVGEFIALLIVGGLLLYYWPRMVERSAAQAEEKPLPSAGWGCLVSLVFAIGVPIVGVAIFLLALVGGFITFGRLFNDILGLGGASLGLVIAAFIFVLSLVTKAVVAFLGGRLILTRLAPQMQPGWVTDFWSLALGAFIYEVLRIIPFLGWLIGVLVTLVGLGAIYFVVRETMRPAPAVAAPATEAPA